LMVNNGFSSRIVAPLQIRLFAKAPHPFPGAGFSSNAASLGTGRFLYAEGY
jgi:hypothetical protein